MTESTALESTRAQLEASGLSRRRMLHRGRSAVAVHIVIYVEASVVSGAYFTMCGRLFSVNDSETVYERSTCTSCRQLLSNRFTVVMAREPGLQPTEALIKVAQNLRRQWRDWQERDHAKYRAEHPELYS